MTMPIIIDAHAHCGIQDDESPYGFSGRSYQSPDAYRAAAGPRIKGAVFFAPVMEIYDRHDPAFEDTPWWRQRRRTANEYLAGLSVPGFEVIPYFFIWNDFAVDQLTPAHRGIKWHRHDDEPEYRYHDPACASAIAEIRRRSLPVVLEEELRHTVRFIRELAVGVRVVIPHLGMLNGGYEAIREEGLWEIPTVWADTALAGSGEIRDYLRRYGHERLLFGSDFPFGNPERELRKIEALGLDPPVFQALTEGNLRRLIGGKP